MVKFVHKKISYDDQDRLFEELCKVLLIIKKPEGMKNFLKDLLGRGERVMLVRRFKIAKMLENNKSYAEIAKAMGTSSGTIAKIERLLNFGRNGYREAIKKIRANEK